MGQAATRARSSDKHAVHTADCYVPVRANNYADDVGQLPTGGGNGGGEPPYGECAVCMERLEWVAIGACGHPSVCAECTVRLRFVHGDRRCCICRKHLETAVVTRGGGEGVYARMLAGRPAACQGFWYHHGSTTYFDDKRQYKAAKRACAEYWPTSKYCPKHRRLLFRIGCFSTLFSK